MTQEFTAQHSLVLPGINLDQYFGLWAIAIDPFQALIERWNGINLHAHVSSSAAQAAAASQAKTSLEVTGDGIAMIAVRGPLMKSVSSMSDGTSLTYLRRQVSLAAADDNVRGIMLVVDSPGGTTAGTADAADALVKAAAKKPVVAFVEDCACSAAVWLASQASKVWANQGSAVYGSIGVYATLIDASKRAEQLGIKVHVIRTGPKKGAGVPGDAVTPEQLANLQEYVDAVHGQFLNAVALGRKRTVAQIQEHADGGIFTAASAVGRGLIDGIQSFDAAYAELVAMARSRSTKPAPTAGVRRMSEPQADNAPKPATIAELKAACPGAPSDWLLAQIESGATLASAQTAFIALQNQQLQEARANAEKAAKESKASGGGNGLGVALPGATRRAGAETEAAETTGDPVADFHAAVSTKMRGGLSRFHAVQAVSRENPQLHREFLKATNDQRCVGAIDDRFAQKPARR